MRHYIVRSAAGKMVTNRLPKPSLTTLSPGGIGCSRYTKLRRVEKHVNIIMKPSNPPTQGQPNPRKMRSKVAFWATFSHFFPQQIAFRGLGLVSCRKHKKPNPIKFSANTLMAGYSCPDRVYGSTRHQLAVPISGGTGRVLVQVRHEGVVQLFF